jgi:hypothetical protein
MSFINYLKYSGVSVTMTVNPCHWAWIPRFFHGKEDAWDDTETLSVSVLFLTMRIWIDDGSW